MSDAPDIALGCTHPRENSNFYGNFNAELELFEALNGNRMHHAWILNGPKGVGKATLAYRFARRYLGAAANNFSPLSSDKNDKIFQQIAQNSCPDLRVATRYCPKEDKVKSVISVHAIRELISMFDLRANNILGRRVAIIDCADDLNDTSANALLKTLEEPPKGAIIFLIANSLGAILPTIRSRCRVLHLKPSALDEIQKLIPNIDNATRVLSNGCYGRALVLKNFDIEQNYRILSRVLGMLPNPNFSDVQSIAKLSSDIDKFEIIMQLIESWLNRAQNAFAGLEIEEIEPGESANMARIIGMLDSEKIFSAWDKISKTRKQVSNHLDKSIAVIELIFFIQTLFKK